MRKARPAETLLPVATRWLATLPFDCYPLALAKKFPRIANALATFWTRPDALTSYLGELLVDRRGGRKGFPLDVLDELDPKEFWQIHRSTVVRVDAITQISRDFRGKQIVHLKGSDEKLEVSRSYSHLFKQM